MGDGEGTDVIEGDIASKYIKGGKGYLRNRAKIAIKHIKRNPGKVGKAIAPTAVLAGSGVVLLGSGANKKKKK